MWQKHIKHEKFEEYSRQNKMQEDTSFRRGTLSDDTVHLSKQTSGLGTEVLLEVQALNTLKKRVRWCSRCFQGSAYKRNNIRI